MQGKGCVGMKAKISISVDKELLDQIRLARLSDVSRKHVNLSERLEFLIRIGLQAEKILEGEK
jgi:hypothetical protein